MTSRLWVMAAALLLPLTGCSETLVPSSREAPPSRPSVPYVAPSQQSARPAPATAQPPLPTGPVQRPTAHAPISAGPSIDQLGLTQTNAAAALAAFRISCSSVQRRTDASGLTIGPDWTPACTAAASWNDGDAISFFSRYFEADVVGDGRSYATGYYEPEIHASRTHITGYDTPIYSRPNDLVDVDLGTFSSTLKGKKIRGRVDRGSLVLYPDRAAIDAGALANQGYEIAWAADPIEFFFLQIQGSGRLILPDGSIMRIGYDSDNGRDYVGIGGLMRDRGLVGPNQLSMQGIMAWLRANPGQARPLMQENKSFVFFKERFGPGPLGAMGVPVTARVSVAADPAFTPLGAPIFLQLDRKEASGLWVAQDTGGAIKGANRVDTFWGAGPDARQVAGGMSGRGQAWVLLPIGTLARINGQN